MLDLRRLLPGGFGAVRLDAFRAVLPDLWSEEFFRANELASLYIDARVAGVFRALGARPGDAAGLAAAGGAPARREAWEWLGARAEVSRVARGDGGAGTLAAAVAAAGEPELRRAILAEEPLLEAALSLVAAAAAAYPDYLRGRRSGREILFEGAAAPLWERYFDAANPVYEPFNRLAAEAARRVLEAGGAGARGARLLEVGAGCGSGSEALLAALPGPIEQLLLTDVSPGFLRKASERVLEAARGKGAAVECRLLDLDRPPAAWRLEPRSFDLVFGVNVLHAVRDLEASLRALRAQLRPGGHLVLGECIRPRRGFPVPAEFVFQLLQEPSGRAPLPSYRSGPGFLDAAGWRAALGAAGFESVAFLPDFEAAAAAYPEHSVAAIVAREPPGAAEMNGAPAAGGAP